MSTNKKTRAGLKEKGRSFEYQVSTTEAKDFLQQKIDRIIEMSRKSGQRVKDIEEIALISESFSRKFVPFMIALPPTALSQKKGQQRNRNELSMFNPMETQDKAKLIPLLDNFIKCYVYTKEDMDGLKVRDIQRNLGITYRDINLLKQHQRPHRYTMSKKSYIVCFIDPIKVFADMLSDPDQQNIDVDISIDSVHQISETTSLYTVMAEQFRDKKFNRRKHNIDQKLAKEIRQNISRSGR